MAANLPPQAQQLHATGPVCQIIHVPKDPRVKERVCQAKLANLPKDLHAVKAKDCHATHVKGPANWIPKDPCQKTPRAKKDPVLKDS